MGKSKLDIAKDAIAEAQSLADLRAAVSDLEPEQRNQLGALVRMATERIVAQE